MGLWPDSPGPVASPRRRGSCATNRSVADMNEVTVLKGHPVDDDTLDDLLARTAPAPSPEAVNSGSMPRGQAKLSAANLAKIKAWIDAGALNN